MKKSVYIVIGLILLTLIIKGGSSTDKKVEPEKVATADSSDQVNTSSPMPTPTTTPSPASKLKNVEYKIVEHDDAGNVENYRVLIIADDYDEDKVKGYISEVKADECKKPCNISVYDTQKAVDLDISYGKLLSSDEMTAWKKKNYVYVGDHLIGSLSFELDNPQLFPMRDWYYYELKDGK